MRIFPSLRTASLAVIPAAAVLLLGSAHPSAAQIVVLSQPDPVISLRGGVYLPQNSRERSDVGSSAPTGGVDFAIDRVTGVSRIAISVDYLERQRNDNLLRMIPVTIGQFHYEPRQNLIRPYLGYGVGAYFVSQKYHDIFGIVQEKNTTLFGGFLAAGVDFSRNFFLEARYHITQSQSPANPGGVAIDAGVRF